MKCISIFESLFPAPTAQLSWWCSYRLFSGRDKKLKGGTQDLSVWLGALCFVWFVLCHALVNFAQRPLHSSIAGLFLWKMWHPTSKYRSSSSNCQLLFRFFSLSLSLSLCVVGLLIFFIIARLETAGRPAPHTHNTEITFSFLVSYPTVDERIWRFGVKNWSKKEKKKQNNSVSSGRTDHLNKKKKKFVNDGWRISGASLLHSRSFFSFFGLCGRAARPKVVLMDSMVHPRSSCRGKTDRIELGVEREDGQELAYQWNWKR
jgi:hypothetical protein